MKNNKVEYDNTFGGALHGCLAASVIPVAIAALVGLVFVICEGKTKQIVYCGIGLLLCFLIIGTFIVVRIKRGEFSIPKVKVSGVVTISPIPSMIMCGLITGLICYYKSPEMKVSYIITGIIINAIVGGMIIYFLSIKLFGENQTVPKMWFTATITTFASIILLWGASELMSACSGNSAVYICDGPYSSKYHSSEYCEGLENCSGVIHNMKKKKAIEAGYEECEYCYGDYYESD